jgi:hypothetical protein
MWHGRTVEQTKRETPVKYIGTKDVQTSERRATDEGNHTGETKETLLPLLLGIDITKARGPLPAYFSIGASSSWSCKCVTTNHAAILQSRGQTPRSTVFHVHGRANMILWRSRQPPSQRLRHCAANGPWPKRFLPPCIGRYLPTTEAEHHAHRST